MTTVLALDPGFGNTKVGIDGYVACMQSAIARPQSVGKAAIGLKTASQVDIIRMDGYEFAIGPGAWHWGSLLTSRLTAARKISSRAYGRWIILIKFTTSAMMMTGSVTSLCIVCEG